MREFFKKNNIILAPMSGVTDVAFREICREHGCSFTYSEFASTKAIVQGNLETEKILKIESNVNKGFVCVQVFGSDVESVKDAVIRLNDTNFDFIELNCSCPAPKIFKNGAGSALLDDNEKMFKLLKIMCKYSSKPVFVKLRLGVNKMNVVENALLAEKAGVKAITVHGRTKEQGYSGKTNWNKIFEVKKRVKIPVIGNGDIHNLSDAEKMISRGIDAVSIGRAAMSNPLIFCGKEKSEEDCVSLCLKYLEKAKKYGVKEGVVKNHLLQFTKGLKNSCSLRKILCSINSIDDMIKIIEEEMVYNF